VLHLNVSVSTLSILLAVCALVSADNLQWTYVRLCCVDQSDGFTQRHCSVTALLSESLQDICLFTIIAELQLVKIINTIIKLIICTRSQSYVIRWCRAM